MEYINPVTAFGGFDVRNDEMTVEGETSGDGGGSNLTDANAGAGLVLASSSVRRSSGFPSWILALGILAFILALSSERSR
jgi:hypothetical protein